MPPSISSRAWRIRNHVPHLLSQHNRLPETVMQPCAISARLKPRTAMLFGSLDGRNPSAPKNSSNSSFVAYCVGQGQIQVVVIPSVQARQLYFGVASSVTT